SSRRRQTRSKRDWSSDVCSSDLGVRTSNSGAGGRGDPEPDRLVLCSNQRQTVSRWQIEMVARPANEMSTIGDDLAVRGQYRIELMHDTARIQPTVGCLSGAGITIEGETGIACVLSHPVPRSVWCSVAHQEFK